MPPPPRVPNAFAEVGESRYLTVSCILRFMSTTTVRSIVFLCVAFAWIVFFTAGLAMPSYEYERRISSVYTPAESDKGFSPLIWEQVGRDRVVAKGTITLEVPQDIVESLREGPTAKMAWIVALAGFMVSNAITNSLLLALLAAYIGSLTRQALLSLPPRSSMTITPSPVLLPPFALMGIGLAAFVIATTAYVMFAGRTDPQMYFDRQEYIRLALSATLLSLVLSIRVDGFWAVFSVLLAKQLGSIGADDASRKNNENRP